MIRKPTMDSFALSTASANGEPSRTLLASLLAQFNTTQNADGGWPFHASGGSRVEPTCWALLALAHSPAEQSIARGLDFLELKQLPDGSWPAADGVSSGGWVTSLAACALAQVPNREKWVKAACQWLCDDYPRDSSRWQKLLKSFSAKHESHNNEFRGWGWTPRTSSWVEPTSFALLALASVHSSSLGSPADPLAKQISDRRDLAIGLLYDRMCAGGGWNCGNPRVYGVDGDSLVLPTCWALLALRDTPEHPNRALSLAWLEKSLPRITSSGSLAVAQITLEAYRVPAPRLPRELTDFSVAELAEQGTHVLAWVALKLNPARSWPVSHHGPSGVEVS